MEPLLIYKDDFNSLNENFWTPASHTFENNLAKFSKGNLELANGKICIKLTHSPKKEKQYTAAEIRSKKSFKYGKFVARLKAAKGDGIISAFFLYDNRGKLNHEIDVEFTGKNTSEITFNNWINKESNSKTIDLNFDASKDFHTYTISWLPNEISWEIDEKKIYSTNVNIPFHKMKFMLSIWASKSNDWSGTINPTSLPKQMEVDYIKIYSY